MTYLPVPGLSALSAHFRICVSVLYFTEGHHITDKEDGDEYVGEGEWFADF